MFYLEIGQEGDQAREGCGQGGRGGTQRGPGRHQLVPLALASDEKEPAVTKKIKNVNKIQFNKLEEKDIDVSNIVVEKKEEKKELKTWIVEEDKIQDEFRVKFDMAKVDTDFTSLTDDKINKELAEVPPPSFRNARSKSRRARTK